MDTTLDTLDAITDPAERARQASDAMADQQQLLDRLADIRRIAVEELKANGVSQATIAQQLGITQGRVSQMLRDRDAPIVTGWLLPPGAAEHRIALCGSRSRHTNTDVIDLAVSALAGLLMRHRCRVSHGPIGIGVEVLTHIADQHRPPNLRTITGLVGHANVIRPANYVLVVGGGQGTQAEVDLAINMGRKIIPMPASGGTATRAHALLTTNPNLRNWMTADTFDGLAATNADTWITTVEQILQERTP